MKPADESNVKSRLRWVLLGAAIVLPLAAAMLSGLFDAPEAESSVRNPVWMPAQAGSKIPDLKAGRFLVSQRDLPDPHFAETVVLLVAYNGDGAMGLVLNDPSPVPLSRLLRSQGIEEGGDDPVYIGGPVMRSGVTALVRSTPPPKNSRHVFEDVHLISNLDSLTEAVRQGLGSDSLRVFAGYSGWGPGQLEGELRMGTWHVFKGNAAMVFDPHPETLWDRFIRRTELRIASLFNSDPVH